MIAQPSIDIASYGDVLLQYVGNGLTVLLPYAAALTALAVVMGMIRRWLGHRNALDVGRPDDGDTHGRCIHGVSYTRDCARCG